MTADPAKVAQAMKSVIDAHAVLNEFYKEVVAFYRIVDEQLAEGHGAVRLEAHMTDYIVRYPGSKMKVTEDWLPKWMGRFYFESDDDEGAHDADGDAATGDDSENVAVAFVWVVPAAAADEAPQFSLPECWLGVAHPGEGHRFKHSWDAAQNGVWHRLETSEVLPGRWVRGTFAPDVNRFGKNGFWHAMRVPLAELLDEQLIREKVTNPLRAKYREAFSPAEPKARRGR